MPTINTEVVAAHAQHVQLFGKQLDTCEKHVSHNADCTTLALGMVGVMIFMPMTDKMWGYSSTVKALSEKADEVERRIDATATTWHFIEQANTELVDTMKTTIEDPDLMHWPESINDFPDSGMVSDIGGFASNCPQYAEAGAIPVVLGSVGMALDVLGWVVDPVGTIFGTLAGLIIDLCVPLKEVIDALMGDPGALQQAATAYEQTATFLSEAAHGFAASLGTITPATWDQPGASDVYLRAANNLVQLAVLAGEKAVEISGDIVMIGSFLGDLRNGVIEAVMGFVIAACFEAATGAALAPVTLGASIAVSGGIISTQAMMTAAGIAVDIAAASARLGAAAMVANSQKSSYDKLVADIKK